MGRLVQSRRARQTGTVVEVWKGLDDQPGWQTVCVDHAGICEHDTRKLALAFAPVPIEWCSGCQAANKHLTNAARTLERILGRREPGKVITVSVRGPGGSAQHALDRYPARKERLHRALERARVLHDRNPTDHTLRALEKAEAAYTREFGRRAS